MIPLAIWYNRHLRIFQRLQIALPLRASAICNFVVFEKYTCAYLHQITLEITLLPILNKVKRYIALD